MRPTLLLFAFVAAASPALFAAGPERQVPAITFQEIPTPAAPGSSGGSLVTAPDGSVWLSWLEPMAGDGSRLSLKFSTLAPSAAAWTAPRVIATGANWFVNWADFPAITAGRNGHATAVWFVSNPVLPSESGGSAVHDHHGPGYHAVVSSTRDHGQTWSGPEPLTRESNSVEFVSLATLADGRVLACWLDGRAKKAGRDVQQLFARVLGTDGADQPVDASVCDCCQTTLTAFPDGTALLAYRGRSSDEVRDIRHARFRGRNWDEPRPLHADDWRIQGCPVNGPQLASDGGRVAAAWFTAADNDPRVLASFSPDAGARFLMPLRLDADKPAGRVDTILLRDGAMLVSWLGVDGALWLRRITPEFTAAQSVRLGSPGASRATGVPRIALRRDYAGGRTDAELVVVAGSDGDPRGLSTLLVTVPEGALLEAERECECTPSAHQLRGYPIRGTILAVESGVVRVRHPDVPGIFAAGTQDFRMASSTLAPESAGRQFLGRIEPRDGDWWLFDVRIAAIPAR